MATRRKTTAKTAPSKKERAILAPPREFALGAQMATLQVSDHELAERLQEMGLTTDRTTVWKWATGLRQPQKDTIPKIAEALGINASDLWRQPGLVDLNAAARHITDNTVRKKLADFLRDYPAS